MFYVDSFVVRDYLAQADTVKIVHDQIGIARGTEPEIEYIDQIRVAHQTAGTCFFAKAFGILQIRNQKRVQQLYCHYPPEEFMPRLIYDTHAARA